MIEITVTCNSRIDRAEAPDPEGAILAGQTLFDEAYEANGGMFRPMTMFVGPDGQTFVLHGRRP